MSTIDLKSKATTVSFVETIEIEAAKYLGLSVVGTVDSRIRPYAPYIPSGLLGAASAAVALSSESAQAEKKDEKRKAHHYLNVASSTLSALFTSHQARSATRAREISESYQSAALLLKGENLYDETPLQTLGGKIYDLTTKVVLIDKLREKEATNYLHCGIFGSFGAGLLALGAYVPAAWMKSAGKVALVATLVLYAYTWLSHRGGQATIMKTFGEIGPLAESIRRDLHSFTPIMQKADAVDYSTYAPLVTAFEPAK